MHRLLTIDDMPVLADGIRRIATEAGIAVQEIVHARPDAWEPALAAGGFHAAIISIRAPHDAGTTAVRRIARLADAPPILALCEPCESVYGVRLLRLGAQGVIGAHASAAEIATALSRTLAGRRHLSQTLADHVLAHVVAAGAPREVLLRDAVASDAQLRLVQLLALGKPISVICSTLRISADDAKAQRREVLRRTGLTDDQELKRHAFDQHLVPDRRQRAPATADPRRPTALPATVSTPDRLVACDVQRVLN